MSGRLAGSDLHDHIQLALRRIFKKYGHEAAVLSADFAADQFGSVTTQATDGWVTVQSHGGNETLQTTNAITHIQAAVGDTHTACISGIYIDGNDDWIFLEQNVILTGSTPVLIPQPLVRANYMCVAEDSATVPTGPIEATVGSGGTVVLQIPAGGLISEKTMFSTPTNSYGLLMEYGTSYTAGGNNSTVECIIEMHARAGGNDVWIPLTLGWFIDNNRPFHEHDETLPVIVPPEHDIRIRVDTDTNSTNVSAFMHGLLALRRL